MPLTKPVSNKRHGHGTALTLVLLATSVLALNAQGQSISAQFQEQSTARQFEVASIRPSKPGNQLAILRPTLDGIRATNCTLLMLAAYAYGPTEPQLGDHGFAGAPRWADSDLFDLTAKVSDADVAILRKLNPDQRQQALSLMMRKLLTDRFQLAAHKESREVRAYDLVVSKAGPKLPEGKSDDPALPNGTLRMTTGEITGTGVSMARLATALTARIQHPVNDATGLNGTYNFALKWQPEEERIPEGNQSVPSSTDAASGPSIFTALQEQLGLRLVSRKGHADIIIIDHAARPSEN